MNAYQVNSPIILSARDMMNRNDEAAAAYWDARLNLDSEASENLAYAYNADN